MLILHASWLEGHLWLWGEVSLAEDTAADIEDARRLSYGASATDLVEASAEVAVRLDADEAIPLQAWLPTYDGVPAPSSPLLGDPALPDSAPTLEAWQVTALRLPAEEAVAYLSACVGQTLLAPGILLGDDMRFWTQVLRFAGALVAREQFLPSVAKVDGQYRAVWDPVIISDEVQRWTRLTRMMPAPCRLLTQTAETPPDEAPAAVLNAALGAWVDALVRGDVGRHRRSRRAASSFGSLHDQWLVRLGEADGTLDGTIAELQALADQAERWRQPVALITQSPFRLCFRLEEPAALVDESGAPEGLGTIASDPGPWTLRYLLQAADDPSLLVEVGKTWQPTRTTATLFEERNFEARTYLLAALGQAMSLYPALEKSLQRSQPGGTTLTTAAAHTFLTETASLLQQAGYGVLLPTWWTRRGTRQRLSAQAVVRSPPMQASGGLSLDTIVAFNWQVALGETPLSQEELEALARLKLPLVRIRGQWVQVDAQAIQAALDFWRKKDGHELAVREVLQMALGVAKAPGNLPFAGVVATGWVGDLLAQLKQGASIETLPQPEGLDGTLRPYQVRGYSWLAFLRKWGLGACLADDMGLGKTIQALALVQRNREANDQRPSLLVCPTSVIGNWRKEAARFTPDLAVQVHHGTRRTKKIDAFKKEVKQQALVVTGFPLLHRDLDLFKRVRWSTIILDEAQNIKNPVTKQAQAARSLKADHQVALTGTPVENNVGELWSIMEFLNPGFLGQQAAFKRQFFIPIQSDRDPEAAERLKQLTGPFILRRLKTDKSIIDDLPEKLEMNVMTTLTKEQASLYRAVVKETNNALNGADGIQRKGLVLATLMKLKQICNHPAQFLHDGSSISGRSGKLIRLTEMLMEIQEVRERSLIFTQFTEMGAMLKQHLQETFGQEALFLHGSVPRAQREQMVERFQQAEGGSPFFILSLKAGGTGLNLTRANHVFHFDRWWNPAVENQATDRAFRIGQTRQVQVHKFVSIGTVEERIDEMIQRKQDVADSIVGTGEAWITELSTSALKKLFRLQKTALG